MLAGIVGVFATAFVLVSWSYVRAENALREEARQKQEAQRREKAERWERYRSNLTAASSALQIHNVAAARDALEAAPREHRGWEWHHFHSQLDTADRVLPDTAGTARILVSADGDKAVRVHRALPPRVLDVRAGKEVGPLALGFVPGESSLSPDGKVLACCRPDNAIALWDVLRNRPRAVLRAPAGNSLVCGSAPTARVWRRPRRIEPFASGTV